ncbi:MAG: DMT family transporter [Pseudomonadota bacterium]
MRREIGIGAVAEAVPMQAIVLGLVAFLCFGLLEGTAKYLGTLGFPLVAVVWFRYMGQVVLSGLMLGRASPIDVWRCARPRLQILRGLLLFGATAFNFTAIRYLRLDETGAINFAIPLLVAAFAVPILGERVGPRRWAAIVVGFLGVLVIVRPTPELFQPAALLSLAAAICGAFYVLLTRIVARTDGHLTSNLYAAVVGAAVTTPLVPFFWQQPVGWEWLLLAGLGLFGGLGHYLLTAAHRYAAAPVLAPLWYTQIVWLIGIGYLVFGDVPDSLTVTGAAIVVASGLYVSYRERRRGPR